MRSGYHVRRATIEDLPALLSMWQSLSLPTAELQHRLTEFQVLESPSGLLGAVGFEIIGREGRIHGEAFSDFGFADHFRPELWERLQAVARSKGVVRA
jgi:N-acetylglutamate synthase-like GNAT family acetyltransferase